MKHTYLLRLAALLGLLGLASSARAQSVGIGTTSPDASAVLDVSSTRQGLLPPRLSQAQRDAITSTGAPGGAALSTAQAGLTVYNTTTNRLNFWDGARWQEALGSGANPAVASSVSGAVQTMAYSGRAVAYQVPAGCTLLLVVASGAQGSGGTAGLGGQASAVLKVTPGEVLAVVVGGTGAKSSTTSNGYGQMGGYNGGGTGGGGATDVRRVAGATLAEPLGPKGTLAGTLGQRLLVAGGGGGTSAKGGSSGGAGANAADANGNPGQGGQGGQGGQDGGYSGGGATSIGTGISGGGGGLVSGGSGAGGTNGNGSLGVGGTSSASGGNAGGGGGYYGGGGGTVGTSGGGGSSWASGADCLSITFTGGVQAGNGQLVLTPQVILPAPAFDASNLASLPGRSLPAKAVPFSDGNTLLADAPNFSYDNATHRLGLGTSTPSQKLEVAGTVFSNRGGFQFPDNTLQTTAVQPGDFIQNGTSLQPVTSFNIDGSGAVGGQFTAGTVGIGTSAPIAKLHVSGGLSNSFDNTGNISYFTATSGFLSNQATPAQNRTVCAYFEGGNVFVDNAVHAGRLSVSSDARIKRVVGRSSGVADLALLNQLRITDYTYLDPVAHGSQVTKKVIAQEVEAVLPAAVSRSTQALPNVYARATAVVFANGTLTLTCPTPHGLPASGGRLRLYTATNQDLSPVVEVLDARTVRFAAAQAYPEGLFVYGKYVDDFRSVDYDALTTLTVSATQQLARQVAALEARNAGLQQQQQADHASLESLQAELVRLREAVLPAARAQR